jgi:hypothetical protein
MYDGMMSMKITYASLVAGRIFCRKTAALRIWNRLALLEQSGRQADITGVAASGADGGAVAADTEGRLRLEYEDGEEHKERMDGGGHQETVNFTVAARLVTGASVEARHLHSPRSTL